MLKDLFHPDPQNDVDVFKNRVYVRHETGPLELDLYVPKNGEPPFPLIVWVPGGAWFGGEKGVCYPMKFGYCQTDDVRQRFAVAGLSYRCSSKAPFPAQLEDLKAAIRWIRARAEKFDIDPNRIGAMGTSAGGHLASLLGVTGNVKEFDVGDHLDQSSAVRAVCNFYGATDFSCIFEQLRKIDGKIGYMQEMVGRFLDDPKFEKGELTEPASPVTYVGKDSPPFLIVHGTEDPTVPFRQAEILHEKLEKHGVESRLISISGAGHGNGGLFSEPLLKEVALFFDKQLRG